MTWPERAFEDDVHVVRLRSAKDAAERWPELDRLWARELRYGFGGRRRFTVRGWCPSCGWSELDVGDHWATRRDGELRPEWREQARCRCGLTVRLRSTLDWLVRVERPAPGALAFCAEATTPFARALVAAHPLTIASEFVAERAAPGSLDAAGLRCESLERFSFPDGAFDVVLTLDVLEHVFDWRRAFSELLRVTRPGGVAIHTVPFWFDHPRTVDRARLDGGRVVHLLPPVHHGDPVRDGGALLVHEYGWDLLDAMREIGWRDPELVFLWSEPLKYLGLNFILRATRPA